MGYLLKSMGQYAESEPYLREAFEGRRRVLGASHKRTIATLLLLAEVVAQAPERKAEVEALLQGALANVTEDSPIHAELRARLDSLREL